MVLQHLSSSACVTKAFITLVQVSVIRLVRVGTASVTQPSHNSLYQVSLLKEAGVALTHSQSNPAYTKEKTTAVRGTRSLEEQVSASPVFTTVHTEIRENCCTISLHIPTCLHSPITYIFYYICRVSSIGQLLPLIWHLYTPCFNRLPTHDWGCYCGNEERNNTKQSHVQHGLGLPWLMQNLILPLF